MAQFFWKAFSGQVLSTQDPWALLDGRANAPAGTPQFPTLLNTYHAVGVTDGRYRYPSTQSKIPVNTGNIVQPPWMVAGVDYAVGIDRNLFPTNASLTSAASISQTGVSLDTTNHLVNVTGNNVTLSGIDFSVSPGWALNITGNNCTVINCYFKSSTTQHSCPINMPSGTGLTIVNTEIDENFQADGPDGGPITGTNVCCVQMGGTNLTVKYCYMHSSWADIFDLQTGGTIDLHFNLFQDIGNINSHPDVLQIEGTPGNYGPSSVTFNTTLWTAAGTFGPQNYFWTQTSGITLVGLTEVAYCTVISQATSGPAAMAAVVDIEMSHMSNSPPGANTARIHDLFCDPTGVQTNWALVDPETSWNYPQGKVWNNTNMTDGTIDQGKFAGTGP